MKILAVTFKAWLVLAILAAVLAGYWATHAGDVNIFYDDEPVTGASAVLLGIGASLIAIIVTTVILAIVGLAVPLGLAVALATMALVFIFVGVVLAGVLVTCALPILIPVGVCVLLLRALNRPKATPT